MDELSANPSYIRALTLPPMIPHTEEKNEEKEKTQETK